MALELIVGSSGAGKSYQVYQEIIRESIDHPEKDYLVLVPEQFTMQTQKDLVTMHPRHGLLNVDVLSFGRLAWRVFQETGGDKRPVLEDLGKSLVLQKVTTDCAKELTILAGTMKKQGSVQEMKSLISELLQYRVKPEDLEEWLENSEHQEGMLRRKISDVRLIYQSFLDYLSSRYLTTEEVPELLCGVIGDSALVRGSTVVLDGFTGFTPVQLLVIQQLLGLCETVRIVVTADPDTDFFKKGSRHRLFYMSCRMVQQVTKLASETGCELLPIRKIRGSARFANQRALAFLERNTLRSKRKQYPEPTSAIRLRQEVDPEAEVRFVTAEILRLVREEGYRWKDFAVVCGDLGTYGDLCGRKFDAEAIPCFIDRKKSVLENPLVEFVRSAMNMIVRSFSYESVFRFLRTSLAGFTAEEADYMENYVLACGIRGWKQYNEKWIRETKQIGPDQMDRLNALRGRFVELMSGFTEGMRKRGATLRKKAECLYEFLVQNELQQKAEELAAQFEEAGDESRAKEYRQIYREIMAILDKMTEILGEETLGNAEFLNLLEAGFSESSIGLIPPGEDQVIVGDLTRTRLKKIRVLFLLGVNEGVVPKVASSDGILSEADRSILGRDNLSLAPDRREELASQRFYLYLVETRPSDKLYLSFCRTGSLGDSMTPSYVIAQMRELFPCVKLETGVDSVFQRLETDDGLLCCLLDGLRKEADDQSVVAIASANPSLFERLCHAALLHSETEGIGKETALALYGAELTHSASRLETFAACAYRHFARYGLRASERELYQFTPADLGTLLHSALELFTAQMEKRKLTWASLTDADRVALSNAALERIVHDYGNTVLHSSARREYEIQRLRRIMDRTTWALQNQMIVGSFHTEAVERTFRDELETMRLPSEKGFRGSLIGKIDRIDVCDNGVDRYVKIIDYKTGDTKFDESELYYGLQLQLALYMNATLESESRLHTDRKIRPAGMFYYHIDDPYVQPGSEAQMKQKRLEKLRMQGLVIENQPLLELIDHSLKAPKTQSTVLRLATLAGGGYRKGTDGLVSEEGFQAIRAYAQKKTGELALRMQRGETAASPYLLKNKDGCQYCPYRGICGYDERIPVYRHRILSKVSTETIRAALEKQGEA